MVAVVYGFQWQANLIVLKIFDNFPFYIFGEDMLVKDVSLHGKDGFTLKLLAKRAHALLYGGPQL